MATSFETTSAMVLACGYKQVFIEKSGRVSAFTLYLFFLLFGGQRSTLVLTCDL